MSYVAQSKVYANYDGDEFQRNVPQSEMDELAKRSGKNIRGYMPKNQMDQVNRLEEEMMEQRRIEAMKRDPTLHATLNGNVPNKGARIDKELNDEDEEMIRKMEARKERKRSVGVFPA